MSKARQYLQSLFNKMKEGEEIVINRHLFQEAYPASSWPGIGYESSRQAFLSNSIGSAWGCWTCEQLPRDGA
jgi:hypothetical protein